MSRTKSIQRSLKLIKEYGWEYWITERWDQYAKRRIDMFNCIDILCLDGSRTVGIQATGADVATHRRKLLDNEYVIPWLKAKNELQMWSWRKLKKKRGAKAQYWHCKITDIFLVGKDIYFEERLC